MSLDRNNLDIPDFLDIDFFKTALESDSKNGKVEVRKVSFSMGSRPGENYCSMIYRAYVNYTSSNSTEKSVSLIVKSLPDNTMTKMFQETKAYDLEVFIYTEVLPKLKAALNGEELAPRFFYFTNKPIETMVLEDVTPLDYILADRIKGLDEEHCALVLKKIARFHAASMKFRATSPEIVNKFINNTMFEDQGGLSLSFERNLRDLEIIVPSWPGFEKIAEKLKKFIPTVRQNTGKWCRPVDDEIKVLVHNDLWTNNILFKYSAGKLDNLLFLDYQGSTYSSPGLDITHFLYTSPKHELLEQKRDFMIEEYYYKTLKATLENLEYTYKPIPSLADILKEIDQREMAGFLWAAVLKLCVICMDKESSVDSNLESLNDVEKGTKLRMIGMSTERYTVMMKHVLRRVDKLGLLDC